jgi:hypothetical protein
MEASIQMARKNRVKVPGPVATPTPNPALISSVVKPVPQPVPQPAQVQSSLSANSDGQQRLKAKPKRVGSPFPSPFEQQSYRSQAG